MEDKDRRLKRTRSRKGLQGGGGGGKFFDSQPLLLRHCLKSLRLSGVMRFLCLRVRPGLLALAGAGPAAGGDAARAACGGLADTLGMVAQTGCIVVVRSENIVFHIDR